MKKLVSIVIILSMMFGVASVSLAEYKSPGFILISAMIEKYAEYEEYNLTYDKENSDINLYIPTGVKSADMLKNKSSFIDIWNGIVDTHASMCESAYDVLQQGKQKDNMNIYIL